MKPVQTGQKRGKTEKPKLPVLYVEDEEENRRVARLRLGNDCELILAANSKEACDVLRKRKHDIGAILMDIELKGSELDGIGLTRLIRGKLAADVLPAYAKDFPVLDVPIIFVTAYGDRYSEKELTDLGGDQLVHKPVDFTQLTMALTQIQLKQNMSKLGSIKAMFSGS